MYACVYVCIDRDRERTTMTEAQLRMDNASEQVTTRSLVFLGGGVAI